MPKRLAATFALTIAALAAAAAPPAAAVEPAERFNAPGQRHVNVCVRLALPLAPLRYADADPTGFTLDDRRTFSDGRCPAGTVRIDHHEQIPSPAGPLVFHRGGNGYADAGNVKYGQLATGDIATALPAPVLSRGGRGAPCAVAAGEPAARVQVRSIPEQMHYKRPQDVASGSNRGASFEHYGDPASDQGDGGHGIHYSYLLWSFVNVRGGGIVRTLLEPDRVVRPCDVAPITMSSWDRAGAVNGQVTARYVKTFAGSCPLYGWMVWSHDDYTDASGPVAHARTDASAPADPAPAGAGCPVQEPAMPPGATTGAAYGVRDTAAGVTAAVDPAGVPTNYRFEYGPAPGAYAASTPTVALGPDVRPSPAAASIGGLQPGTTYHYRVVASNSHGTTYGADAALTTFAPGSGTAPPPPPPPVELNDLRVSPSAFRPARKRSRKATWIRWTAKLPGTATFTFARRAVGMRVGGTCRRAPARGLPRRAKRCGRWHRIGGSLRAPAVRPGRNALKWNGWIARRKLARATYRITAVPTSSDARTGDARHARFTVR